MAKKKEPKKPTINTWTLFLVPTPGSLRGPCKEPCNDEDCLYWRSVYEQACVICQSLLGPEAFWCISFSDGTWAHNHCFEARREREQRIVTSPTLMEAAANQHDMTLATFKSLPIYERNRMMLAEIARDPAEWGWLTDSRDLASAEATIPDVDARQK